MTKTTEKRLVQMPSVEHIKSIKQKLREAKSKYEHNTGASKPLTAYSLHKLLEEKELPTLAISALQNMFNPELNSKTIDVTMVAILCKLFDVNLSYVLALPEDQAMLPEYSSYNSAFQALTDPYYRQLGKPYNYNYFNVSTRKKFYCSQLVWVAFKDNYGIDLDTSDFGDAVHPMELVNSSKTYTIYKK